MVVASDIAMMNFSLANRTLTRGLMAGLALGGLWIAGRAIGHLGGQALVNWKLVRALSLLTAARRSEQWPE
ncbi:MAG: hypothetical protein C4345_11440, partial [Chloroflexota bacterium]